MESINKLLVEFSKIYHFLGDRKISNGSQTDFEFNKTKAKDFELRNGIETEVLVQSIYDGPEVIALRSNTSREVAEARQRHIIKMLFVVVLEFFICWTPIYTINTITLYSPKLIYKDLGYNVISFFHLLAFFSSCSNPITYCFMNSKFRLSFLSLFKCKTSVNHNISSPVTHFYHQNRNKTQTFESIRKSSLEDNFL